ncbi:GW domain-containing glycosaminoglycan-binding protein, partial [Listeria welshimeri]|nr:GW domain-containing glycosaminoglycan-binding protein [Listeria welshimeri]
VTRAKVGNTLWYEFKIDGEVVGWVSEKDVNIIYTPESEKPTTQVSYLKNPAAMLYNKPVEAASAETKAVGFYYGKLLVVDKEATIQDEQWVHIKENNNSLGWIKAADIQG